MLWIYAFVGIIQSFGAAAENDVRYQEVYSRPEAFRPVKGSVLTYIDIVEEMHFEMDIEVHSIGTGHENVLHCGSILQERQPAIWIHPDQGFANRWFTAEGQTNANFQGIEAGQTYHLEFDMAPYTWKVTVDGVETPHSLNELGAPLTYENLVCYASNPWNKAADATISNLFIGIPLPPVAQPTADPTLSPSFSPTMDCSVLNIDGMLSDCSGEFDTIQMELAALKDSLSNLEAQMQVIVDSLDGTDDISVDAAAASHSETMEENEYGTDNNAGHINWTLMTVVIGGLAVVAMILVALLMKKRNKGKSAESTSVTAVHVPEVSLSEIPSTTA